METFHMSRKEVPRPGILKAALAGRISNEQGATALGLSVRQFQRLKDRFRVGGPEALIHRGRGRPSARGLPKTTRQQVLKLLGTTYAELNDCHATEKLREIHRIDLCRETVRRLRQSLGRPAKRRRRAPKHRIRRLPEARLGALVQVDASPHGWLQDRGPIMALHGAIDDATGAILALHFRPTEDLHGYASVLHDVFRTHGLPLALYGDRTNIFVRNDTHWSIEEELAGVRTPTHLGRALCELGVGYIEARSPQAKGRVENRWATCQDRLTAEMALAGIATMADANAFLPAFVVDFNRRFARTPRESSSAWRRPPKDWEQLLACRYRRHVARDNTVSLPGRWMQLPPGPRERSWAGAVVDVRELLDGRLLVFHDERLIGSQVAAEAHFQLIPRQAPGRHKGRQRAPRRPSAPAKSTGTPPASGGSRQPKNHAWRRQIHADVIKQRRTKEAEG
jgi:hypothetical protein